jgi:glycosyltransferase involved in cell wall biosynthesis
VLHSLSVGGAEVLAARLARQLGSAFRFLFVCLDDLGTLGEELQDEAFSVVVLHRQAGLDWRATFRLAQLFRRQRVALVHAHQYTPFFYALTARCLGRRVPILFTEHGRHLPDYPRRKRIVANRLLLGRRDRVVGVGQAVRQALIANEGIPAQRVAVIYNGIAAGAFAGGSADRGSLRAELDLGADDLVLIQVARLDYLKDQATAVRTLQHVVAARPEARLILVGDGPERAKIEAEVRARELTRYVRFLGQRGDVARLLGAADVFLLTSISEGIPLTVIEAMCAGLPVVSTAVGGVGEIVIEGQTGWLAPAGDDRRLAEHVLRLAAAPDLRRRMGEEGRDRARAVFSEGQMHAAYVRLYREMLDA